MASDPPGDGQHYTNPNLPTYGLHRVAVHVEGFQADQTEYLEAAATARAAADAHDVAAVIRALSRHLGFPEFTPALTAPSFPLGGSTRENPVLEHAVAAAATRAVQARGYEVVDIGFGPYASVAELLETAKGKGAEGVLLVRFYGLRWYLQVANWNVTAVGLSTRVELSVGSLRRGLAVLGTVEMYDARSGNTIYYSFDHCGDDHLKSPGTQTVERLFVESREGNYEDKAAEAFQRIIMEGPHGIPQAAKNARDESVVGSDKTSRVMGAAFWSSENWHRWQIDAAPLGPSIFMAPAYTPSGAAYRYGAATLVGFQLYAGYVEFKNFGFNFLGLGVGFPTNVSVTQAQNPGATARATAITIDVIDLRYMMRATDRFAFYLGVAPTVSLLDYSGYEPGQSSGTEKMPLGVGAAFAGVRWETFIPVDLSATYYNGTKMLGARLLLNLIGTGRRPYAATFANHSW
jgi:hypothetical protein